MENALKGKTVYLAGPMRGYPKYNYDAFEEAEACLSALGINVLSPHRMDLEIGFDPTKEHEVDDNNVPKGFCIKDCIRRDTEAILKSDAVVFLPNWQRSTGAQAERAVAKWLGVACLSYPTLDPITEEDVLEEALRITGNERNDAYGPPNQDFARTAKMWTAIAGHKLKDGEELTAKDMALFMIALKISRATWSEKRDNWVDIAGYARCGSLLNA